MSITANRIKELRKQKKLTQQELAKMINSTSVTISRIESGARNPSYALLALIAERLHTNIDYLSGKSNNPEHKPFYSKNKDETLSSDVYVPEKNLFVDEPIDTDNILNAKERFFISDVKLNGDEYKQVQEFINYLLWKRKEN